MIRSVLRGSYHIELHLNHLYSLVQSHIVSLSGSNRWLSYTSSIQVHMYCSLEEESWDFLGLYLKYGIT